MLRKQWRGVRTELTDELVAGLFRIAFELGNLWYCALLSLLFVLPLGGVTRVGVDLRGILEVLGVTVVLEDTDMAV
jgi:hypothetical protein